MNYELLAIGLALPWLVVIIAQQRHIALLETHIKSLSKADLEADALIEELEREKC